MVLIIPSDCLPNYLRLSILSIAKAQYVENIQGAV